MARDIDEKIVQMRFENSDFESGAKQSIKTLNELNKATDSLGEDTAGLDRLVSAIEKVNGQFGVMESIARGALERIGSQAVAAGEQLAKSMTIDQVTAGWQKYDEKTRATKTIMNATGESIEKVNGYLEKLMWFTDETSYNFVDMTSNIGKFTSAGVDLDTATDSMIGIANWAALAGQGANEASRAMYNLSQALGRGYVQWMDWTSIVNANMDTKEIKEMFIETAKAVGTLDEAARDAKGDIVTFGNFGETLKEGWLTTDVLNATLGQYADFTNQVFALTEETGMSAAEAIEQLGAAYEGVGKKAFLAGQVSKTFADALDATADAASSRWMSVFEMIFGNLEQQEVFWTDVTSYMYDAFVDGLDAVTFAMKQWETAGGSLEFLGALETAMEGVVGIIQIWGDAWDKAFGPLTGDTIFAVSRAFQYFLLALIPTEEFLDNLSSGLAGILSIFGVLAKYVTAVAKGFEPLLVAINQVFGGIGGLIGISGDFLTFLSQMLVSEQSLAYVTAAVSTVIETLINALSGLLQILGLVGFSFYEAFSQLTFSWKDGVGGLDKFVEVLKADFGEILTLTGIHNISFDGALGNLATYFSDIASRLSGPLSVITEKLSEFFSFMAQVGQNGSIKWDELNLGEKALTVLSQALQFLSESFEDAADKGATLATALRNFMGPLGTGVREFLDYLIDRLSQLSLGDIADVIAAINVAKLLKPIQDITDAFSEMMGSISGVMEEYQKKIKVDSFMTLAKAIGILAASLFLLSKVPLTQLAGTSAVLVGLGASLTGFMYAINKITDGWDEDRTKQFSSVTKTLIPVALAIMGLASSVKKLAGLEVDKMAVAVAGIGALLVEMAAFVKLVNGITIDKKSISSLSAVAIAIRLLVKPISRLGQLDLKSLAKGIAGVGIVLAELAGFTFVAGKGTGSVLGASVGMIALAGAMATLIPVIKKFGEMDWGMLGPALLKFGSSLLVVTAAMVGLSKAGSAGLAGAAGLSALAVSFALLIPQMALIAKFEWESIAKVIAVFAGVLGSFTIAGLALAPVGPIFAAVAASLAAFNISVAVIIAALAALTKALPLAVAAFLAFSAMSSESVQQGVTNIGLLLEGLIDTFISLKAKLKVAAITYLSAIVEAIAEMAPDIANGVLIIVEEILHVLNERLPDILEELDRLLELIEPYAEKYAQKAGEIALGFVEGFLKALWSKAGDVATEIGEWLDKVFFGGAGKAHKEKMNNWFAEEGRQITSQMYGAGTDATNAFERSISNQSSKLFGVGKGFSDSFLGGVDKGLDRHSPPGEIIERASDTLKAWTDSIKAGATKLGQSGEGFASNFAEKLKSKLKTETPVAATSATDTFVDTIEKSGAGTKAAEKIAKQVTDDGSIEEAAKKKAEAVANAFTTEFNKISSQLSAIGSKFGIAEAYLGPEDELGTVAKKKALLELQQMQEELQVLADKYNISWDKYQNVLANPEASTEETQSMYAEYLAVYEELAKKANDIASKQRELYGSYEDAEKMVMAELQELSKMQAQLIQSAEVEASQATQEAYNNFVDAVTEEQKQYYYDLWNQLKKMDAESVLGDIIAQPIDADKIRNEVYAQLGLDPNNPVAGFMSVEELINQAVQASQQTYLQAVEETYPDIINTYESKLAESGDEVLEFVESEVAPKFARSGSTMAEATADGVELSTYKVSYSGKQMSREARAETNKESPNWQEVGEGMMDGIIDGIKNRRAEVIEAAIEVALAALAAAKNALGIASPSKEFLAVGMYAIDGLRIGIIDGKEPIEDASESVATGMVDQFGDVGDRISHILDDSIHPVIDPTLDLAGVKRAAKNLDNIWSSSTLQTLGDISLSELSRRDEIFAAHQPAKAPVSNFYNFTQNNTSPRPLSDAEIYRQTKKELEWAFKGVQR